MDGNDGDAWELFETQAGQPQDRGMIDFGLATHPLDQRARVELSQLASSAAHSLPNNEIHTTYAYDTWLLAWLLAACMHAYMVQPTCIPVTILPPGMGLRYSCR